MSRDNVKRKSALQTLDYLEGKSPEAVVLFKKFQRMVMTCGPSEVTPRRTIVYWKRKRVFAGAFIHSKRLELNIDLLRKANHPALLSVFPTTKTVFTHRLRIFNENQLDEALSALVREAYKKVGPGTRTK